MTPFACVSIAVCSGAGRGLFTSRPFKKNEVITEYAGRVLTYKEGMELRRAGKGTHLRALDYGFRALQGITKPKHGMGGASFANDARNASLNNARFYVK